MVLVWLYRLYPSLLDVVLIVKPETLLRWHRRGLRAYWWWKSGWRGGRPKIEREIRDLIRRMSRENPLWGAPRIHGELLMLGSRSRNLPSPSICSVESDQDHKAGRLFRAIMPPVSHR